MFGGHTGAMSLPLQVAVGVVLATLVAVLLVRRDLAAPSAPSTGTAARHRTRLPLRLTK